MTTTTETESIAPVATTRLATYAILAVVVATVVNVFVRTAAVAVFGVPAGFGPLGIAPVVNTTVAGVLGATGVYGLLLRVSTRPNRAFLRTAIVVLALSFAPLLVPPPFLAEAPASVLGTLAVMHVTTAGVVVGLLPRTGNTGTPLR